MSDELIPMSAVERVIFEIRGERVVLDEDLARLYSVETKALNRAVKRNPDRFPADFMFQLSPEEFRNLRYQSGTSRWGGRRYPPLVFTEHGALMAANVLNSPRAIKASVYIVRAFIKLRQILIANMEIAAKLVELETKVGKHGRVIRQLVDATQQFIKDQAKIKAKLAVKSDPARPKVGFRDDSER